MLHTNAAAKTSPQKDKGTWPVETTVNQAIYDGIWVDADTVPETDKAVFV